ncbi:hypothetical protein GCM10010231_47310 [Streptomyces sindenensis]|nr:hypothetical protein GCM10010231_47310 [Streptomyces sindenensis]
MIRMTSESAFFRSMLHHQMSSPDVHGPGRIHGTPGVRRAGGRGPPGGWDPGPPDGPTWHAGARTAGQDWTDAHSAPHEEAK